MTPLSRKTLKTLAVVLTAVQVAAPLAVSAATYQFKAAVPSLTVADSGPKLAVGQLTANTSTDFGTVDLNVSSSLTFTFTNTGEVPATDVVAAVGGSSAVSLSANTCGTEAAPVTVAAGATCTVTVQFTPTTSQTYTPTLTVTAANVEAASTLQLVGTGITPASLYVQSGYTNLANPSTYLASFKAPYTLSSWFNLTAAKQSPLMSLGPYCNTQSSTIVHIMIAFDGKHVVFAPYYSGWTIPDLYPIITPTLNSWFHLSAEVSASGMLKVAVNGTFVFSQQLSSSYAGGGRCGSYPQYNGGYLGLYEPNLSTATGSAASAAGTFQNFGVYPGLIHDGINFTPEARH